MWKSVKPSYAFKLERGQKKAHRYREERINQNWVLIPCVHSQTGIAQVSILQLKPKEALHCVNCFVPLMTRVS